MHIPYTCRSLQSYTCRSLTINSHDASSGKPATSASTWLHEQHTAGETAATGAPFMHRVAVAHDEQGAPQEGIAPIAAIEPILPAHMAPKSFFYI